MKHFVLLASLLIACASATLSQGTLQFNQIKLVGTSSESVPTGKVWKIESFWQNTAVMTSSYNSGGCIDPARHSPFQINGNNYYKVIGVGTGGGGVAGGVGNDFPLWLPAGTTVATVCPNNFLSVIEFNIVGP